MCLKRFPDEILTQYPVAAKGLREAIRAARDEWEPVRVKSVVAIRRSSSKGLMHESDTQALHCAMEMLLRLPKTDHSPNSGRAGNISRWDGFAAAH
jgi:hypothetical protein